LNRLLSEVAQTFVQPTVADASDTGNILIA
jgi:hypothetical protein